MECNQGTLKTKKSAYSRTTDLRNLKAWTKAQSHGYTVSPIILEYSWPFIHFPIIYIYTNYRADIAIIVFLSYPNVIPPNTSHKWPQKLGRYNSFIFRSPLEAIWVIWGDTIASYLPFPFRFHIKILGEKSILIPNSIPLTNHLRAADL